MGGQVIPHAVYIIWRIQKHGSHVECGLHCLRCKFRRQATTHLNLQGRCATRQRRSNCLNVRYSAVGCATTAGTYQNSGKQSSDQPARVGICGFG
jgi:hypothetical protein